MRPDSRRLRLRSLVLPRGPGSGAPGAWALEVRRSSARLGDLGHTVPELRSALPFAAPARAARGESRGPSARLRQSGRGGRGPACRPFPRLLTCNVVPGGVERPETLSLSSRGDPNGHRTLRAWTRPIRQTSETSEAETLPKVAEPPSCSAWAVTWASGGPRRRPRRKGAQIRPRGWGTAGRLSPFTSSTGFSTSTAHTLPRGSDLREGRGTGTPPSPPRGASARPGGASP